MLNEQGTRLVKAVIEMLADAKDSICDSMADLCDLMNGKAEAEDSSCQIGENMLY